MVKDVLIICDNPEVFKQIQDALPADINIRITSDLPAALSSHKTQFDLVFIDVTVMTEPFLDEFQKTVQHFAIYNPMVQFVSLAPTDKVRRAVQIVRQGANDYLTYPLDKTEIRLVFKTIGANIARHLELNYLRDRVWKPDWLEIIRTTSPAMGRIFESIHSVAPTIATVLLLGETGTGKGLMASLIHKHSHRCEGPFIVVHCGAIPDTLLESELFGHERGAFTGAVSRKFGQFELARDGTIFLDEIGTVSAAAQVKLLQVLQDGTFSRVGGSEQLQTNARIITATNADLVKMVAADQFRKDLFYRLNIFPIELPPLKDRIEDLPHLIDLFLTKLNAKYQRKVSGLHPEVEARMQAYDWPGNLRELENILERAMILEAGDVLGPECFPAGLTYTTQEVTPVRNYDDLPLSAARQRVIEDFERYYLANLLAKHKGQINVSAREAGISTRQLSRLTAKYGLDKKTYKP